MAFNPSSTIYLCSVPFDNTYKNQVYFSRLNTQYQYFMDKAKITLSEYTTVRKTLPDGGVQSSIKVNVNIDTIHNKGINYMMYQNLNHGARFFYAFIEKAIYINEEVTELIFETDVFQTWLFDVDVRPSYVVREHSDTDNVGDNITPEKFGFEQFSYLQIFDGVQEVEDTTLDKWGYLVGSTNTLGGESVTRGRAHSGIYQGLYFYYFNTIGDLNNFLDAVEEEDGECIQFVTVIPEFLITDSAHASDGYVYGTSSPKEKKYTIPFRVDSYTFNGYTPKNKKLYTSPFFNIVVSNHTGDEAVYNIEDFDVDYASGEYNIEFKMFGDVSANPSLTLYPLNYQHITNNYDAGISISGFPQCSINSDSFKLWLAKNQGSMLLNTASSIGSIGMGVIATVGTGGVGAVAGLPAIAGGVTGIMNTINGVYQASREPNRVNGGGAKNNLLTALKMNKFSFYYRFIKPELAKTVDDFFTMYGYQVNRIKGINYNSRPHFNYVQTVDVNITGEIPNEDMKTLKQMYNSGVTFWNPASIVGDYTVDNSPATQ